MGDHRWNTPGREWEETHVQDRENLDFDRNYPYYSGSAVDYQAEHANRYGETESFAPDGRHSRADGSHEPRPSFPRGSSRERDHREYRYSTQPRNQTREAYETALSIETTQFGRLDEEQREYYMSTSGGLIPSAHSRLIPPARRFDEFSEA